MSERTKSRPSTARWSSGFGLVAVGTLLIIVGIGPVEGFVGGMLAGVGFALTLIGVVRLAAISGWLGSHGGGGDGGTDSGWWLPSRDRDR